MPKKIIYKDNNGNIQQVNFDSSYPVEVSVNEDTDWTLKATDPVNGTETIEFIGGRSKRG